MSVATRVRVTRRPVHGVLLIDKPLGLSSNQALQKAKWLLRAEKAGHTGTLDPLASGLLPLCFGAATKFSQLQLEAGKTYRTVVRLGISTSTADAEGQVIKSRPVECSAARVAEVLAAFTGPIQQVPPMHSALKKDGKALYEYARAGASVEREPRSVTIEQLELLDMDLQGDAPQLHLRVRCSKGTYIRTLGEDIGEALGCGGHLVMLRREACGGLDVRGAITLEELEALDEPARLAALQRTDILLTQHRRIELEAEQAARFLSGMRRRGDWPDTPAAAVYGRHPEALLGVGHVRAGELVADRLLSPLEIQQTLQQTSGHTMASV